MDDLITPEPDPGNSPPEAWTGRELNREERITISRQLAEALDKYGDPPPAADQAGADG